MPRFNDHHFPCPGGCGNLSDECACPRPNPLGAIRVTPSDDSYDDDIDGYLPLCRWRNCREESMNGGFCDVHLGTL